MEDISFDKILNRLSNLNYNLQIDPSIIAQKVCSQIYDGICTSEIDELSSEICMHLETSNLEYGILGKRIVISNNHKNTPNSFTDCQEILYNIGIIPEEIYNFIIQNKYELNNLIDNNKDFQYTYFGFKTLEKSYLLRDENKNIVERIQYMLLRVSIGLHVGNLNDIKTSYYALSDKYFIHATPTLFHSGTTHPQLLSCFLLGTDDSVKGMYKNISDCAQISKWAGGIGLHISNIRSKGSLIKSTNGTSNGIIPLCKVYNEVCKHINQSGKRNGSTAMYLEPHHPEIEKFINLRKNHGNEDERTRDLFIALWISDLFMKRVENNEKWSLFDSMKCPNLENVYGEEYEKLYLEYEEKNMYERQINAQDLWKEITKSLMETGTPYILYKDNANKKTNQNNLGTIKSSNLCAEIIEYSDDKEYACCVLASISLPKFVENKKFNFDKLIEILDIIVKNLNKIIDKNYYPIEETKISNMRHRPLGIGVQGLADTFILMDYSFESIEAKNLNKLIFETIYYGALKSSNNLAKEFGHYDSFIGSNLQKGLFQFDLWNVKPSNRYDWDNLRKDISKYGVRNSLLTAVMPTASTSQILGNNECIEPYTSNIYARRVLAGDFVVINKHLQEKLTQLNLWNDNLKNNIIYNNGSIQNISIIPNEIKDIYKTAWEIKQKTLVQMSIDRGPYIDQSQSLNLFFEEPEQNIITGALFYGWKNGLKTGSYYIRNRPKIQAQQFTISPNCDFCSA